MHASWVTFLLAWFFRLLGVSVWVVAYPNCPNLDSSHHSHSTTSYNNYNGNIEYYEEGEQEDEYGDGNNYGVEYDDRYGNPDNIGRYYPEPPYVDNWYPGSPMPQPCTDATSNPRGRYSSNLAPCTIAFHRVKNQRVSSAYSLSDACTDSNILPDTTAMTENTGEGTNSSINAMILPPVVRDYIQNWPDECVGDFQRCYEVPIHERYYFNFVCQRAWQFPEGATHISVNCTADKAAKVVLQDQNNIGNDPNKDPYLIAQQQRTKNEIQELEIVLFVVLSVLVCSCFACFCATYALVIRPYQNSVLHASTSTERDGLVQASNGMTEAQIA